MHKRLIFEGGADGGTGSGEWGKSTPELPFPYSPFPNSLLRHLITAFDQGLQIAFFVADEDCEAWAGLRISGLSEKDHFTAVIDRGLLVKGVESLFRRPARNWLINGRDLFEPFGGFDEKPLIAPSE